MSTTTDNLAKSIRSDFWNVPNQLTTLRLILSIVLFVFLSLGWFLTSMVLFMIAAGTDWVDGYWARKYGQVTMLGRILDPFVDKIIICGTFTLLGGYYPTSGIHGWMAVVIVGRELLVTALRSFLEQQGTDFSAKMSGKLKMVFQCLAAATSLYVLAYPAHHEGVTELPQWLTYLLHGSVWTAIFFTVYSGIGYVVIAGRLLRKGA